MDCNKIIECKSYHNIEDRIKNIMKNIPSIITPEKTNNIRDYIVAYIETLLIFDFNIPKVLEHKNLITAEHSEKSKDILLNGNEFLTSCTINFINLMLNQEELKQDFEVIKQHMKLVNIKEPNKKSKMKI